MKRRLNMARWLLRLAVRALWNPTYVQRTVMLQGLVWRGKV